MLPWMSPSGMVGAGRIVRIPVRHLRDSPSACPMGRALDVRRDVAVRGSAPAFAPVADFPFKPWGQLVDQVEFHGAADVGAALIACGRALSRSLPQHVEYAAGAAAAYRAAWLAEQAARDGGPVPRTLPVAPQWMALRTALEVPDARGVTHYERTAWGRQYASSDGSVRELVIPCLGPAKEVLPLAELSAVASVLLCGRPVQDAFATPAEPVPDLPPPPQRMRIFSAGLADGRLVLLRAAENGVEADWTPAQVQSLHDAQVAPRLARALDGRELKPGSDCVRCKGFAACPAVLRAPGVLVAPPSLQTRKRRSVSVSDLRAHHDCPARYHLTRVLKLRDGRTENEALRRGRAVDAWLNERHADPLGRPCHEVPLPDQLDGLSEEELPRAIAMLRSHRRHCPLNIPAAGKIRPQYRLAVHDPRADVLVVADCDLLYEERGGVVLRETKTASRAPSSGLDLLEKYPQLALGVLLLQSGVLGGDARRSRVELEMLRSDGPSLEEFSPRDAATVERARAVLAGYSVPWAADSRYEALPRVGYACTDCEALSWCATGRERAAGDARATGRRERGKL